MTDRQIQTFLFLTDEKGGLVRWCETNSEKRFFQFLQYVLDNSNSPGAYIVRDVDNEKDYNLLDVAEFFEMSPRSWGERMSDTPTYNPDIVKRAFIAC